MYHLLRNKFEFEFEFELYVDVLDQMGMHLCAPKFCFHIIFFLEKVRNDENGANRS